MNNYYQPLQPVLTDAGMGNFGLSLQKAEACDSLTGIVHSYLQVTASYPTTYPVIPDGTQAIFMSAKGSLLGGAQSEIRDIPMPHAGEYFGIRFYPGMLRHFLKLNLSEIMNKYVNSNELAWRDFGVLHGVVYQSQGFEERAASCERWLLDSYNKKVEDKFDRALTHIYKKFGDIRIDDLAKTIGLSGRHLNRLFRSYTGLNTKAFAKIIQMQSACRQLLSAPKNSQEAALTLGYFDQPHLLRDYRRHLQCNPRDFFCRFVSDFYKS